MKFLGQIEGYVEGRHIKSKMEKGLIKFLEREGFDKQWVLDLARLTQNERVKLPMAKMLLGNAKVNNITVDYKDNEVKLIETKE